MCTSKTFGKGRAMARDSGVLQRQHFCHHGDTICHPKSGHVMAKLHGTSTCGCNNNAIFPDRAMFTFPSSSFVYHRIRSLSQSVGAMLWSMAQHLHISCRRHIPATLGDKALTVHAKVPRWRHY